MIPDELRRSSAHVLVDRLDDDLVLDDDLEHHLRRVLRLMSGETVSATDGHGGLRIYRADVASSLTLHPLGPATPSDRDRPEFTLVTAIPKGDRVDWLVQKTTELGVDRIRFVHAERSVVRWKGDRAGKQLLRLQRIADEAVRQSRRRFRVTIEGPVDAVAALAGSVVAEPGGRRLAPSDTIVAIGPEGGWVDTELDAARDRIDLGPNVLRTETAAVAVCALTAR